MISQVGIIMQHLLVMHLQVFLKRQQVIKVFYGKTVPHVYQVTFDLKGGAFPVR